MLDGLVLRMSAKDGDQETYHDLLGDLLAGTASEPAAARRMIVGWLSLGAIVAVPFDLWSAAGCKTPSGAKCEIRTQAARHAFLAQRAKSGIAPVPRGTLATCGVTVPRCRIPGAGAY